MMNGAGSTRKGTIKDITLSDYIERLKNYMEPPKKLTFEEWWYQQPTQFGEFDCNRQAAAIVWNAAQENKA